MPHILIDREDVGSWLHVRPEVQEPVWQSGRGGRAPSWQEEQRPFPAAQQSTGRS